MAMRTARSEGTARASPLIQKVLTISLPLGPRAGRPSGQGQAAHRPSARGAAPDDATPTRGLAPLYYRGPLPELIKTSTDPPHHADRLLPVHLGIGLRHGRRAVAKDDAGDVQSELLPQPGCRVVPELVRVTPVLAPPGFQLLPLLGGVFCTRDLRERWVGEGPVARPVDRLAEGIRRVAVSPGSSSR